MDPLLPFTDAPAAPAAFLPFFGLLGLLLSPSIWPLTLLEVADDDIPLPGRIFVFGGGMARDACEAAREIDGWRMPVEAGGLRDMMR